MEIKLLEHNKKQNKASFVVKGTTAAYMNTLRKYVLERVPTLAIEDVEFRENSSILYDEVIAHRLGLTPLRTDLKSYSLRETCKCKGEGCARCTVQLTLEGKGPGSVYASDLKSKDSHVKPIYPGTPIVKLLKGQEIELEAKAVLGQGKDHSKWSPGLAYYRHKPIIEAKSQPADPKKLADMYPEKVLEVKNGKLVVNEENALKCATYDIFEGIPHLTIKQAEDEFIFTIESWGQLDCDEIMTAAVDIFQQDLEQFAQGLKKA